MKGIEAHLVGRLGKDAEQRTTKAGKPMTVLQVVVPDQDADTWCTVLAFEGLAERLASLPKGAEIYAKGRLKAEMYCPEGGEPRVSMTLLASHVEPLVLERKQPRTARPAASRRPAAVYGDGTQRRPADTSRRPATAGAFEPFDDDL